MIIIHHMNSKILLLLLFVFSIFLLSVAMEVASVAFNLNFSDDKSRDYMTLQGDSYFNINYISLTKALSNESHQKSAGRATYKQPVVLWGNNREVANFEAQFSFLIATKTDLSGQGDGFTFFLSPFPSQLAADGNYYGGYLGLFDSRTALDASLNEIVAVEFDTYLNPDIDPQGPKGSICHIGIDINTIYSSNSLFIENCRFLNSMMTAQVKYNSKQNLLSLLLWSDAEPNKKFNLNETVEIQLVLPSWSAVGFSASTGDLVELHHIFSFSFNSTIENKPSQPFSALAIVGVIVATVTVLSLVGILMYHFRQKWLTKITGERDYMIDDGEFINQEFEKGSGPKRFLYSELARATNYFADNAQLGEGGFGSVYKGILKSENIQVAVKRVSKESNQGKKEYISEVKIISQLRHRNLVQLVGWCHDHGELLLVYELMHNGSLDKHLYSKESLLIWPIRWRIALGLGSALLYLHEEWGQRVVHRDIKPSNIMLDSRFTAKLGDFGLARLIEHNRDLKTTILAGTRGYIAPECVFGTANASTQSDVYSFGVVLLEITCGRRPIVPQEDETKVSLVELVWNLYAQKAHLEAVDNRLDCDFIFEEAERLMVVGLWCAHPEKSSRPSIKQAMTVLQFQAPLPKLPFKMPVPVYNAPVHFNMQSCNTSVATSSAATAASTKSAPVVSTDSSWLLKQQANTM